MRMCIETITRKCLAIEWKNTDWIDISRSVYKRADSKINRIRLSKPFYKKLGWLFIYSLKYYYSTLEIVKNSYLDDLSDCYNFTFLV